MMWGKKCPGRNIYKKPQKLDPFEKCLQKCSRIKTCAGVDYKKGSCEPKEYMCNDDELVDDKTVQNFLRLGESTYIIVESFVKKTYRMICTFLTIARFHLSFLYPSVKLESHIRHCKWFIQYHENSILLQRRVSVIVPPIEDHVSTNESVIGTNWLKSISLPPEQNSMLRTSIDIENACHIQSWKFLRRNWSVRKPLTDTKISSETVLECSRAFLVIININLN